MNSNGPIIEEKSLKIKLKILKKITIVVHNEL